ncbi:MAG: hypothetical protein LBP58_08250 [Azoarcus sp.]|nr:hypothetical protein [Azoarcus sp.]
MTPSDFPRRILRHSGEQPLRQPAPRPPADLLNGHARYIDVVQQARQHLEPPSLEIRLRERSIRAGNASYCDIFTSFKCIYPFKPRPTSIPQSTGSQP